MSLRGAIGSGHRIVDLGMVKVLHHHGVADGALGLPPCRAVELIDALVFTTDLAPLLLSVSVQHTGLGDHRVLGEGQMSLLPPTESVRGSRAPVELLASVVHRHRLDLR